MDIISALKNNKQVSDYRIIETKKESYELFFVHESLETVRKTDTKEVKVTVYTRHDNVIGEASFNVYNSTNEKELEELITKAVNNALLMKNQDYKLVSDGNYSKTIDSNFTNYDIYDLAAKISADCFSLEKAKAKINALEIFINKTSFNVKNSQNVDKTELFYDCMVEAIPTFNGENLSVELYEQYHFTNYNEEMVKAEISSKLEEVEMRFNAKTPESKLTCPVIFRQFEFSNLLTEICGDLNYGTIYAKANCYNTGDKIQSDAKYDKLNIKMVGIVEGSQNSSYFDIDGADLKDTVIISDGVAVNSFGSNRFAQYLGKDVTGNLELGEVGQGSYSKSELMNTPHLEIVSTSGLMIDISTDYIGGEVRLAYYFDGKNTYPITGISISSKISDCLNGMKLSKEMKTSDNMSGPELAMFDSFEIL